MVVSIFIIASGERISIQEARIDRVRLRSHASPPEEAKLLELNTIEVEPTMTVDDLARRVTESFGL
jgi:hypothetical protein